jgi:hypothetical protein
MNKLIVVLIILCMIPACRKHKDTTENPKDKGFGNVIYNIQYSTARLALRQAAANGDTVEKFHSQYGDHIASITPTKFLGSFSVLRLHACSDKQAFMTLFLQSPPFVYNADFTNNSKIAVTPILNGSMSCDSAKGPNGQDTFLCILNEITPFVLLYSQIANLKQTLTLPTQYASVNLTQFKYSDTVKKGNILTVDMHPLKKEIDYLADLNIYFGLSDSTRFYKPGENVPFPPCFPPHLKSPGFFDAPMIWSHKLKPWTYNPPKKGETLSLLCTIGFDTENLIQIYAGADNIPYTIDDIIVYAPDFWERLSVTVTSE